jgi:hypothetical protein
MQYTNTINSTPMKRTVNFLTLVTTFFTIYAMMVAVDSFAQSGNAPAVEEPQTATIEVIVIEGGKYNAAGKEEESNTKTGRKARKSRKGNAEVVEPKSNTTTVEIRWIEIPMEPTAPVVREVKTFDFMGDSFPADPDDFYNPAYKPEFLKKKKGAPRTTSFTFMGRQYSELPVEDALLTI